MPMSDAGTLAYKSAAWYFGQHFYRKPKQVHEWPSKLA